MAQAPLGQQAPTIYTNLKVIVRRQRECASYVITTVVEWRKLQRADRGILCAACAISDSSWTLITRGSELVNFLLAASKHPDSIRNSRL